MGHYNMLEILRDKSHQEYDDYVSWLTHHAKNYYPYEPEYFDPGEVKFWNPVKRRKWCLKIKQTDYNLNRILKNQYSSVLNFYSWCR